MQRGLLPAYQAVYVVSDLHLGGFDGTFRGERRNYRIFRETEALSGFVRGLKTLHGEPSQQPIALVLNGDIVDFLADEKPTYFDWARALDKLSSAIDDPEQKDVWKAFADFVASGCGDLVLVLGNHDLELALPAPQAHLRQVLTDGKWQRQGRVLFAMDGAGFACRVEHARVLCLHGNEADPWNAIDFARLNLIRRALVRGSHERNAEALAPWIPNAGTQLVIDYMNGVKRQYQWIDLLKPEEEAAAMVTAAIANMPALRKLVEVNRLKKERARQLSGGFLGGPGSSEPPSGEGPRELMDTTPPLDSNQLLREALDHLERGTRAADLVEEEDFLMKKAELLAKTQLLARWPRALPDILRRALANDDSFDIDKRDEVFEELDALCGPDMDFLVAGHTHFRRARERVRQVGRYYFNSGTWIRLARIPPAALSDELFPELERRLRSGSMADLEKPFAGRSQGLLETIRTVVRIAVQKELGQVRAELMTVEPSDEGWQLTAVEGSAFDVPRRQTRER